MTDSHLRAITAEWGIPLVFVEGNADLTPSKLIGHHNPARVLREDYRPDDFMNRPLYRSLGVLLDLGERIAELAGRLARLGHGRLRRIGGYTDVAPALGAIFTH